MTDKANIPEAINVFLYYNHIITDPRKILLCSLCIILAISVEEGK